MKFVFLVDEIETFIIKKDTSFALMLAAQARGHEIYSLYDGGITWNENHLNLQVQKLKVEDKADKPFTILDHQVLDAAEADAIFIRTDPPFDNDYLVNTWLLDLVKEKTVVLNNPTGVRTVNEKIWASRFQDLVPPTMITRRIEDFRRFLDKYKTVILKPVDGFGGASIFKLQQGDTNSDVAFETVSENEKNYVILQAYVGAAEAGDKRIILLKQEVLGALMRVHSSTDHRNNFSKGATAEKAALTERDLEIVNRLKPHLRQLGLDFVGIDLIGDYLIEVNVTSPTTIREMGRLYNRVFEEDIVIAVEQMVKTR